MNEEDRMTFNEEDTMTFSEALAWLQISDNAFSKHRRRLGIPAGQPGGGDRRTRLYRVADVRRIAEAMKITPKERQQARKHGLAEQVRQLAGELQALKADVLLLKEGMAALGALRQEVEALRKQMEQRGQSPQAEQGADTGQ